MELSRFKQIVACYGAAPGRWPEGERQQALQLISSDQRAQAVLEQQASLDDALSAYRLDMDLTRLESRILQRIDRESRGWVERLVGWLVPEAGQPVSWLRPAVAVSLPLVCGIVLGTAISIDPATNSYSDEEMLVMMGLAAIDDLVITESAP